MQNLREVAGLKLGYGDPESSLETLRTAAATGGYRPFGHLLDNPQFQTLAEFWDVLGAGDPSDRERKPSVSYNERASMLLWTTSDWMFGEPFARACEQRTLTPIGRIDRDSSTKTHAHVVIANPEYTIPLGRAHEDDIMLGVKWWNATRKGEGGGAEIFGVRRVCHNYNLWGSLLGAFSLSGRESPDAIFSQYERLLNSVLDRSDHLRGLVVRARDSLVLPEDVPDILLGTGLPPEDVVGVAGSLGVWAPEAKREGLNGWTLYNAATAYLTWGSPLQGEFDLISAKARMVVQLITADHDRLFAEGNTRRLVRETRTLGQHSRSAGTAKRFEDSALGIETTYAQK